MDQILSLIADLSLAEKADLIGQISQHLKKELKTGKVGKVIKASKKDPSAPKRKTAAATRAWFAFVAHLKSSQPDLFEECKGAPDYLAVCKTIKEGDPEAYERFKADFIARDAEASADADSAPEASDSEGEAAAAAPAPKSAKERLAEMKAAAKKAAEKPAAAKKPAAEKSEKPAKEKSEKPAKEKKEKKQIKKAAAAEKPAPVEEDEDEESLPKKEINGETYWFEPDTNGLWKVDGNRYGPWVGYFQADNEEEPIRYTDSPSDE
jgi:hypothetical protein